MTKTLLIVISWLAVLPLCGQKNPQLVAPGVISTGQDYCTTLTPDGKTLYFARNGADDRDLIMQSQWEDGQWSEPEKVSFTGVYSDTDPLLSTDGRSMYFMTNRNADQNGWKDDYDLWVVDLEEDKWGEPYPLPEFINTRFTEGFPSTASNGNLYFFRANKPGHSEQDIWFAEKVGGGYDTPRKLGNNINTPDWDGHPFVSPDEDYLIFYSYRDGGAGRCDLYISFNENGNWSDPKSLGSTINTEACEMVPFVSRDGKTLYFTRIEDGKRNIYQVGFEAIFKSVQ